MYSVVVEINNYDKTWKQIWEDRVTPKYGEINTLQRLIKLNGFDKAPNTFTNNEWRVLVSFIIKVAQIKKQNNVLEIGCGSGALLKGLKDEINCKIYGVDASKTLLKIAQEVLPKDTFFNLDASEISKIENRFDCIILHSVIQYFPDQNYLLEILNKSFDLLNSKGKLVLLDLPDIAQKNNVAQDPVISALKEEIKSSHPNHLYLDKFWLNQTLISIGFSKITELRYPIATYHNSKYRFSLMVEK